MLSLSKSYKKRLDKQKRPVIEGDEEDHSGPKISKLSEKIPDQYVLASRGYTAKEVADANVAFKTLRCEAEISREDSGAAINSGITFFRTKEELADCANTERKYLKGMLK
jgi:hypothetical protein